MYIRNYGLIQAVYSNLRVSSLSNIEYENFRKPHIRY